MQHIRPIHPFPARMAPALAFEVLKRSDGRRLVVLDPMVGSGTTAVVAQSLGHEMISYDRDPFAVVLARAWCSVSDPGDLMVAACNVIEKASDMVSRLRAGDAFPDPSDEDAVRFIRYWFDPTARKELFALSSAISQVRRRPVRELLWCALSRLIIVKQAGSSLGMDIAHSRPHRVYDVAPKRPLPNFLSSVEYVASACPFLGDRSVKRQAFIRQGDARDLPMDDDSVDVVITSPPYLNAIDYVRTHRFAMVWMGYGTTQMTELRGTNVGAERGVSVDEVDVGLTQIMRKVGGLTALPERWQGIVRRYIVDMDKVLREIARVLRCGGRARIVVGDSMLRRVFIRNSLAVSLLAKRHALTPICSKRRVLPERHRYLPPPSGLGVGDQLKQRLREEVVLTFAA